MRAVAEDADLVEMLRRGQALNYEAIGGLEALRSLPPRAERVGEGWRLVGDVPPAIIFEGRTVRRDGRRVTGLEAAEQFGRILTSVAQKTAILSRLHVLIESGEITTIKQIRDWQQSPEGTFMIPTPPTARWAVAEAVAAQGKTWQRWLDENRP